MSAEERGRASMQPITAIVLVESLMRITSVHATFWQMVIMAMIALTPLLFHAAIKIVSV